MFLDESLCKPLRPWVDTGMQVTSNRVKVTCPLRKTFAASLWPQPHASHQIVLAGAGGQWDIKKKVLSSSQTPSCCHCPPPSLPKVAAVTTRLETCPPRETIWRMSCSPSAGFSETAEQRKCKDYFLLKKTDQLGHITEEGTRGKGGVVTKTTQFVCHQRNFH